MCYKVWVDIVIPLICSLIGGGLTLVGVIITILHTNKTIKNDNINKYKPSFKLRSPMDDFDLNSSNPLMFKKRRNRNSKMIIGMFSNTDKASFEVDAIYINGECHRIDINRYVKKSQDFDLSLVIDKNLNVKTLELKVFDDQNNIYRYKLEFFINSKNNIEINNISTL